MSDKLLLYAKWWHWAHVSVLSWFGKVSMWLWDWFQKNMSQEKNEAFSHKKTENVNKIISFSDE